MMAPPMPSPPPRRLDPAAALKLGAVLAVAAVVRLIGWSTVFRGDGVHLAADSDPHYHVLQAERLLASGLRALWRDPGLDWPFGADVPWPPLFDAILAGAARLLHGGGVQRAGLEQASALVPVILGVATVGLVAALARVLLGRGAATGAALVFALLPAHAMYSVVGRADQHVLEILLSCGVQAAFAWSWLAPTSRGRALGSVATALGLTLSFWTWMGSGFNLVVPVGFACASHVLLRGEPEVVRRIERSLLASLGGAAALLAASLAAWGAPGALHRGGIQGLTGLHVALLAGGAACGAALLALGSVRPRSGPAARVAEVSAAALLPVLAALALAPPLREGVRVGLTALAAANPWYDDIAEFRPLLFSCHTPLTADLEVALRLYGLAIPAALLSAPRLIRRWRDGADRAQVLFLALWGISFLAFALMRRRFAPYLAVPAALLAWEGVRAAAGALAARWFPGRRRAAALLAGAGVVAVIAPGARGLLVAQQVPESWVTATRWLGAQPSRPGAEGVLGSWELGHLALYYGGKPVVVTPFGTEGGRGAMEAVARFDLGDGGGADAALRERRVGWVMLLDPVVRVRMEAALLGPASPVQAHRECTLAEGKVDSLSADFLSTTAARLFYFDGLAAPERPERPIDGLRLVYESPASPGAEGRPSDQVKIYAAVPGAWIEVVGANPSQPVRATVLLRTNQGRELAWSTGASADALGRARLRVPYATGRNGAVQASAWVLGDAGREVAVAVSEQQVQTGAAVPVDLAAGGAAPAGGGGGPAAAR